RNTILQLNVPDALRGRLMGVQMAVVTGGARVGGAEAGAVGAALGPGTPVVSGRPGCIGGAPLLAPPPPACRPPAAPPSPRGGARRCEAHPGGQGRLNRNARRTGRSAHARPATSAYPLPMSPPCSRSVAGNSRRGPISGAGLAGVRKGPRPMEDAVNASPADSGGRNAGAGARAAPRAGAA